MDTSAISSLTTLYPTQKASGISAPVISNSKGDKDGSLVSGTGGGHHHHGYFRYTFTTFLFEFQLHPQDAPLTLTMTIC
jgi:hypothetical protein